MRDVRASALLALEHDRQEGPPSQMQVALLDGYLAAWLGLGLGLGLGLANPNPNPNQVALLDGYLAATDTGGGGRALASGGGAAAVVVGGGAAGHATGAAHGAPASREEMRALLADRAAARQGGSGSESSPGAPRDEPRGEGGA